MNNRILLILAFLGAALAAFAGYHFGHSAPVMQMETSGEAATKGARKVAYWVAPMDANYRRDKPGKSPMGMDLVPVYEDEADSGGDADAVKLSPDVVQNFGVRTATVTRGPFARRIETVGYIVYDESLITHIHMRRINWFMFAFQNCGNPAG